MERNKRKLEINCTNKRNKEEKMKTRSMYTIVALLFAVLALLIVPQAALATGTASGTDVDNAATLDYKVATVSQTPITSTTVTFRVDAVVDFTVTEQNGGDDVSVSPGQFDVEMAFLITNLGNETYDFHLDQLYNGTAPYGGTENFDIANMVIHTSADAILDGGDAISNTISNLAQDTSYYVFITGDIIISRVTDDISAHTLRALANIAAGGGDIANNVAQNIATKQYVFADTNYDNLEVAEAAVIVSAASLTITKTQAIIYSPVGAATYAVPGSIIEYTIEVANAATGAIATDVGIYDSLVTEIATNNNLEFVYGQYFTNDISLQVHSLAAGAVNGLTNAAGDDEAEFQGNIVNVTGVTLGLDNSVILKFQVRIQ
jgi:hypothetical protein